MKRTQNFCWEKVPLKIRPQHLGIHIQSEERVNQSNIVMNFKWAIKIIAFHFDITYVKGNTITHMDALSRQRFPIKNGRDHENSEDRIIQWVRTGVLSRKTLGRETQQDQLLSVILEGIRKKLCSHCTRVEKPFEETKHRLTVERGIMYNTDAIVPPQVLRNDINESVHVDIHGGVAAT